jgi:hypothetical protein
MLDYRIRMDDIGAKVWECGHIPRVPNHRGYPWVRRRCLCDIQCADRHFFPVHICPERFPIIRGTAQIEYAVPSLVGEHLT